MNTTNGILRLLAEANPDPRDAYPFPTMSEDDVRRVRRIMAVPAEEHRWNRHRVGGLRGIRTSRLVMVVGAVAVVSAVALQTLDPSGSSTAVASSPPVLPSTMGSLDSGASEELRAIAARIEAFPDDTGSGDIAQVTTRSWSLWTRIDGERVTSSVVPVHTVQQTSIDGDSQVAKTFEWSDGDTNSAAYTAEDGLMWPLRSLSADDEMLASQLSSGHPVANGPAERFIAVKDAYLQMPVEPAVRAAMLRFLAATPGIKTTGIISDREGRNGIGFAVDSAYSGLPTRYTLIIDPQRGTLLGYEATLTETAGKLNVSIPAVIEYVAWLDSTYVAN